MAIAWTRGGRTVGTSEAWGRKDLRAIEEDQTGLMNSPG